MCVTMNNDTWNYEIKWINHKCVYVRYQGLVLNGVYVRYHGLVLDAVYVLS